MPTKNRTTKPGCLTRVPTWLIGGVILLIAYGAFANQTPRPPATTPIANIAPPATQTPAPADTPSPIAYPSGGIGQPLTWWTDRYGAGAPAIIGQQFGNYEVAFIDNAAGHIERLHTVPMPFIGAQREIRTLLPADAEYINIEYPADRPGTWIEHYRSPSLANHFDPDAWINANPGEFIILYKLEDDQAATRVIVALGNNP